MQNYISKLTPPQENAGGFFMRIMSSSGLVIAPRVLNTKERFKLLEFVIKLDEMTTKKPPVQWKLLR